MSCISEIETRKRRFQREGRYISMVYAALIGIIVASPFLELFLSTTIIRLIELFFCAVAGWFFFLLFRMRALVGYKGWSKILIFLLSACLFQIIFRSDWSGRGIKGIFLLLLDRTDILPYFLPFFVLFLPNERHMRRIFDIFFFATMLTIPLWVLNIFELVQEEYLGENIGAWLPLLGCFVLVYPNKLSLFKKIALWVVWGIYLLLMLLNARRGMCFTLVFYAFIWFYSKSCKFFRSSASRIAAVGFFLVFFFLLLPHDIDRYSKGIFKRIAGRVGEDSRSSVEMLFWADYITSPPLELALGRGGTGMYSQETIDSNTGDISEKRNVVETGYLMMLLKGGFVFCATIVMLMLTGLIKSCFRIDIAAVPLRLLFLLFFICNYASSFICLYYPHSIVFWLCISLALRENKI